MTLVLRYAARSDVGLVRAGNEDSGYAGPSLLVVADGMGGHAAGELASAAAVATFASLTEGWAATATEGAPDAVLGELAEGVSRTTGEINRVVAGNPDLTGMGTTLTAMAWQDGRITLAHVGDSRAYLLRDGALTQLTVDHTYVQMLVDTGRITADEALTHARRNLIMRAIDGVNDVEPDLQVLEARDGDRYLLCSDGLSGVVPVDVLADLLGRGDPTYAVGALVDRALEGGAPDNVTVVVADVVAVDDDAAAAVVGAQAVVVGAAGERRNREQLEGLVFPTDAEPDLATAPSDGGPSAPVEIGGPTSPADADDTGARHALPSSRGWVRPLLVAAAAVVLLAGVSTAALMWARSQYYVGESDGKVAVFQGLPNSVAGLALSSPYEVSDVAVTSLPTFFREQLATPTAAGGLEEAQRVVARFSSAAAECSAAPLGVDCPSPTSGFPSATTTGPTPSATVTASPSASP